MQTANQAPATNRARWVRVAMVAAVAAVFLLAWLDLKKNQARAFEDFKLVQLALARGAASALSARIEGVVGDLGAVVAAASVSPEAALPVMRRINSRHPATSLYREIDLFDGQRPVAELPREGQSPIAGSVTLSSGRSELLGRLATVAPDEVVTSPLLMESDSFDDGNRLRFYGIREGGRMVVMAVEVLRLFEGLSERTQAGPARWLALDLEGPRESKEQSGRRWLAFAPESRPGWFQELPGPTDEMAELSAIMARGDQGGFQLSHDGSFALGLDPRAAVVGYAPARAGQLTPWSIAVVVSAARVRERQRMAVLRLAGSTGIAALLVGLFGVLLSRQERREGGLAEKLRLAAATASLRERSEKILEAIPVGVLAIASEPGGAEHVSAANPYLVERGVVAGGDLVSALPFAGEDALGALRALLAEAHAEGGPRERLGLHLRLSDGGEPRDVDANAVPLGQPLPDADCFLLLHDRTEVRALERSLVRAEKLATIGTLAAGVAHEVGTPLGIISGRAEQLLAKVPAGESGDGDRRGLSSILAQVDKVSSTIRQLLDFARPRPVVTEAVAPSIVLAGVAALLDHRFQHAQVSFAIEAAHRAPPVAGDPGQLEQVFVNLVINACDACAPGGHVVARAGDQGANVAFEVQDDGAGIAPENLPHVLDPFFTTKKRGQGTGLGLSIAADIVKNHGGSLAIESELGKGTTVRVLLPRAAKQEDKR